MSWFKAPKWGWRLAAIWLILNGVFVFVSVSIPALPQLLAILAIAAGVLMLLDR
jgi:hypothetical protein